MSVSGPFPDLDDHECDFPPCLDELTRSAQSVTCESAKFGSRGLQMPAVRAEEPPRNSFVVRYLGQQRNTIMDREHVKGAADKAKGAIKEGAGKLTGDKDMETEGKIDKAKGSAHNAAGDVKDAARDAADALKK
jgi:uncharacterized protein YjbJ (UPF0337 family)